MITNVACAPVGGGGVGKEERKGRDEGDGQKFGVLDVMGVSEQEAGKPSRAFEGPIVQNKEAEDKSGFVMPSILKARAISAISGASHSGFEIFKNSTATPPLGSQLAATCRRHVGEMLPANGGQVPARWWPASIANGPIVWTPPAGRQPLMQGGEQLGRHIYCRLLSGLSDI
ncbi:hypothetical protein K438DRAFT_1775349 [Mycena galopus ATCC 62051]|nr:hypothetical protein K438DRAFT_1775349 [Mycena galopus ATCC 62051]